MKRMLKAIWAWILLALTHAGPLADEAEREGIFRRNYEESDN